MKLQVTTAVILTAYTGILLCPIEELHKFLSVVDGKPVPTHQLGDVTENLMGALEKELPWLSEVDSSAVDTANAAEFLKAVEENYGTEQNIVLKTPGASISHIGPHGSRGGYWITVLVVDGKAGRCRAGYEKASDFCREHGLQMPGLN